MEVTVAKSAGFCFGVKRAIDTVYQEIEKGEQVFTLGPIIHNEQVVQELADKGVRVIHSLEKLADIKEGTVVIRSHGVSEKVIRQLEKYDIKIVDATCPFVSKIHRIVQEKYREGYRIVIIGSRTHPEVDGARTARQFSRRSTRRKIFALIHKKSCVLYHKRLLITRNLKIWLLFLKKRVMIYLL